LYHGDEPADRRAVWLYDKASRLTAVVERVEDYIEVLARTRCDAPRDDYPSRRVVDRRLFILRERLLRLRVKARNARRAARVFEALATERAAEAPDAAGLDRPDPVRASMFPPELAERIADSRDIGAWN
jgi:hypothetical protein